MKIRHHKADVIGRYQDEYRALKRTIHRLAPGLKRPVPGFGGRARIQRERWTYHDALAHILEWQAHQLRSLRREPRLPELRGLPIASINRLLYERWSRRPSSALLAWHEQLHRAIMRTLREQPESYYRDPPRSAIWPNDLIGHARWHRRHHLEAPGREGRGPKRSQAAPGAPPANSRQVTRRSLARATRR